MQLSPVDDPIQACRAAVSLSDADTQTQSRAHLCMTCMCTCSVSLQHCGLMKASAGDTAEVHIDAVTVKDAAPFALIY